MKVLDLNVLKLIVLTELSVNAESSSTSLTNDDIDQEWRIWRDRFLEIVSRHIPTEVLRRRSSLPWFDQEIRHLMKKKETTRRKAKKSDRLSHWESFEIYVVRARHRSKRKEMSFSSRCHN